MEDGLRPVVRARLMSESSLLVWWPVVERLGIPAPKTVIVRLTEQELADLQNELLDDTVVERVRKASLQFGVPFFLRTDQASGKHDWKTSCFVSDLNQLWKNVYGVLCFNLVADMPFGLPFRCFVVREYIPLEAMFTAFAGEMPVAKERRYFLRQGKVECHHEYWVEGAVRQGMENSPIPESEWLPLWRILNTEDEEEVKTLTEIAERVGRNLGGYWSVDFAKAKDGRWLLIDMGRGELSYHKEGCPYGREAPE